MSTKMSQEDIKNGLRQTTITLTFSLAALGIAIILIVMSILNDRSPLVGIIIAVGMIINMVPAIKKRKALKAEFLKNPRIG